MNKAAKNDQKKTGKKDWLVLLVLTLVFIGVVNRFPDKSSPILSTSLDYFKDMMVVLPAVMILMGLFMVWASKELVLKYMGKTSRLKGMLLSLFLGSLPTGPLYAAFPLAVALKKKGASSANIVVFLSAWACIKIPQELVEIQFLGFKFMITRLLLTIVLVIIMGKLIGYFVDEPVPDKA